MSIHSLYPLNVINEFTIIAPSPHRDYHQFLITTTEFVWRWWKITSRNDGGKFHPGEIIDTYEDFLNDDRLHNEIKRIFDPSTLEYALTIANGKLDILPRLPREILMKMFTYMELEDIMNLSYCSKGLYKLCNDQSLWEELYFKYNPSSKKEFPLEVAEKYGWKKIFFTNKVQLQMMVRRIQQQKQKEIENKSDIKPESPKQNSPSHTMTPANHNPEKLQLPIFPVGHIREDHDGNDSETFETSFFDDTEEDELRNLHED